MGAHPIDPATDCSEEEGGADTGREGPGTRPLDASRHPSDGRVEEKDAAGAQVSRAWWGWRDESDRGSLLAGLNRYGGRLERISSNVHG